MFKSKLEAYQFYIDQLAADELDQDDLKSLLNTILVSDYEKQITSLVHVIQSHPDSSRIAGLMMVLTGNIDPKEFKPVRSSIIPGINSRIQPGYIFTYLIETFGKQFGIAYENNSFYISDLFNIKLLKPAVMLIFIVAFGLLIGHAAGSLTPARLSRNNPRDLSGEDDSSAMLPETSMISYPQLAGVEPEYNNKLAKDMITHLDSDVPHFYTPEFLFTEENTNINFDILNYQLFYSQLHYLGDKKTKRILEWARRSKGADSLNSHNNTVFYQTLIKLNYSQTIGYLLKTLNVDVFSFRAYLSPNIYFLQNEQSFTPDGYLPPGVIEIKSDTYNRLIIKISDPCYTRYITTIDIRDFMLDLSDEERAKQKVIQYLIDTKTIKEDSSFFPSIFYYALSHSSLEMVKTIHEHSGIITKIHKYEDTKSGNLKPSYIESGLLWSALMEQTHPEVIEYIFMQNPYLNFNSNLNIELFYKNIRKAWAPEIMERGLTAFVNYLVTNDLIILDLKKSIQKNILKRISLLFLAAVHNDETLLKVLFDNKELISRLEKTSFWLNGLREATISFANNNNEAALSTIFNFYNFYYINKNLISIFSDQLSSDGVWALFKAHGNALLGVQGLNLVFSFFSMAIPIILYYMDEEKEDERKIFKRKLNQILKHYGAEYENKNGEFKILFKRDKKNLLPIFFDPSKNTNKKFNKRKKIEIDFYESIKMICEKYGFTFILSPPTLKFKKSKHTLEGINQLHLLLKELISQYQQKELIEKEKKLINIKLIRMMKKINASTKVEFYNNQVGCIINLTAPHNIFLKNEIFDSKQFIDLFSNKYEIILMDNKISFLFPIEALNDEFLEKLDRDFDITINALMDDKKQEVAAKKKLADEAKAKELSRLKSIEISQDLSQSLKKINDEIKLKKVGELVNISFNNDMILIHGVNIDSDNFVTILKNNFNLMPDIVITKLGKNYNFSFPYKNFNQHVVNSIKKLWLKTAEEAVEKFYLDEKLKLSNKCKKLLPDLDRMLKDFNNQVDCQEGEGNIVINLEKKFKNLPPSQYLNFQKKLSFKLIELNLNKALAENNKFLTITLAASQFNDELIVQLKEAILISINEVNLLVENANQEARQLKKQKKLEDKQRLLINKEKKKTGLLNQLKENFSVYEQGDDILIRFSPVNYTNLSDDSRKILFNFLRKNIGKLSPATNKINIELKFRSNDLNKNLIMSLSKILSSSKTKISALYAKQLENISANAYVSSNKVINKKIATISNTKKTISDYFLIRFDKILKNINALDELVKIDDSDDFILYGSYFNNNKITSLSMVKKYYLHRTHIHALLYHLAMFFDKLLIDKDEEVTIEANAFFEKVRVLRNALVHIPKIDVSLLSDLLCELRGNYYELSIGKIGSLSSGSHKIELEFISENNIKGIKVRVYHADANNVEDFFFDHKTELYNDVCQLKTTDQSAMLKLQYQLIEKILINTKTECRKKGLLEIMRNTLTFLAKGDIPSNVIFDQSFLSTFQPLPPQIDRSHVPLILEQLKESFNLIIYTYKHVPDKKSFQFEHSLAAINMLMLIIRDGLQRLKKSKDEKIKYYYSMLIRCMKNNNNNGDNNPLSRLYNWANWFIGHTGNIETLDDHSDSINEIFTILNEIREHIIPINSVCDDAIAESKSKFSKSEITSLLISDKFDRTIKQKKLYSGATNNIIFLPAPVVLGSQPLSSIENDLVRPQT